MYNPRTEPQPDTATILSSTTCWANPPMIDCTVHKNYQTLKAITPKIAKEPSRKILPISDEVPNNPKMAMEIFMNLIAKQKEEGNSVYASYLIAIQTYREMFMKYGHLDLADQLPKLRQRARPQNRQRDTRRFLPVAARLRQYLPRVQSTPCRLQQQLRQTYRPAMPTRLPR